MALKEDHPDNMEVETGDLGQGDIEGDHPDDIEVELEDPGPRDQPSPPAEWMMMHTPARRGRRLTGQGGGLLQRLKR